MSGAVTEEKVIHHAQHLDLIYSQAITLYNIITHASWSSNENILLTPGPHADGVDGSTSSTDSTQLVGQLGQLILSDNHTKAALVTTITTLFAQSLEVNYVQTTTPKTYQPPSSKKKNNNNHHNKNASTKPTKQTNPESNTRGTKSKQKFTYPCMVCQADHMTKYCPHLPNVCNYTKKGQPSSQPVVLTNHFPAPQQMLAQSPIPPSRGASSSSATILMTNNLICLSTRAKNCDQSKGHFTTNDTPSTSQPNRSHTIEKLAFELPSHPSKATVCRTKHNFNT